jgi:uncharacterized membrane protein
MSGGKQIDGGFEVLIGRVLRIGVTSSSICLALGLVLSMFDGAAAAALMNLGVVLLILTPAARVVLSIAEYALARDWTFTFLTTVVLLELIAGAIAALVFHQRL